MDHIPQPKNTDSRPFKVPLLAHIEYDGKGFESFPARNGFNFEEVDNHHSAEKIASFIQAWLYFGLLTEFIQKPIDRSMFLHPEMAEDGRITHFVSSALGLKKLKPLLGPLQDEEDDIPRGSDVQEQVRLSKLLDFVQEQCINIDKRNHQSSFKPLAIILLSIRVLVDTLRFVCVGSLTTEMTPLTANIVEPTLTKELFIRLARIKNWCPVHINHILSSFSSPLVCFISQIRRQHRPEITHEKCKDVCIAFNIDEEDDPKDDDEEGDEQDDKDDSEDDEDDEESRQESREENQKRYKTRHEQDGCNCSFISIPVSKMREILDRGGIPLVFLKHTDNGNLSLGVKAATAVDSYVAFSHVWSDGLGNQSANSLPECQLKRLARYIERTPLPISDFSRGYMFSIDFMRMNSIVRSKFFWIDTLCIPVSHNGRKGRKAKDDYLKQLAIEKITPTFARASRVIVLDYEMERFQPERSDWCETATRLLFSAWAGRCWTLQEGALNRACHIQSSHGSFDSNVIVSNRSGLESIISSPTLASIAIGLVKYAWDATANMVSQRFCCKTYGETRYAQNFDRRIRRMMEIPLERELETTFLKEWQSGLRDEFSDEECLEQFVSCWNALGRRQTSKPTDRVMILASLLDLNTFQVKKFKSPMVALMRSLPALPLSLLYIIRSDSEEKNEKAVRKKIKKPLENALSSDDRKARAAQDESNRWLPLLPSSWQLTSTPFMTWTNEWLELEQPTWTDLVLIDPELWNANKTGDLILDAKLEKHQYQVEFMRPKNDSFSKAHSGKICLLIERDDFRLDLDLVPGMELRGACMRVLDIKYEDKLLDAGGERCMQVTALYDCPIRIWPFSRARDGDSIVPYQSEEQWSLKMRHGKLIKFKAYLLFLGCPETARLETRPRGFDFIIHTWVLGVITYGIFGLVSFISYLILIFITVISFRSSSLAVKVAIMLFFFVYHGSLFFFLDRLAYMSPTHVVGIAMYVYAKGIGNLSTLDYVFIILSSVGNVGWSIGMFVYKYLIAPQLYEEWLLTFSPKWPHETKLMWFDRAKKASEFFLGEA